VGLPKGQMGNSEVGHMHMGAGRIIKQDYVRINQAIADGSFAQNPILLAGIEKAIKHDKHIHVLGLLSPGGVHSHEQHIHALAELVAQCGGKQLLLHAILDGRDTPPRSAAASLKAIQKKLSALDCGHIASIMGRYYAMDRDERWQRTQLAYALLTTGQTDYIADDPLQALAMAYAREESDEFVKPTITCQDSPAIADGDLLIFMNFRSDRARQLTRAFTASNFTGFQRKQRPELAEVITLTQYAADINAQVVFPPRSLANSFGEYIAGLGLSQLRIAETEKYAHVTFFFNAGIENAFAGEDRKLIPSPQVNTYDLQPEMSAEAITEQLLNALSQKHYAAMICNFANADMVGHSGNFAATLKAVEYLDACLGRLRQAAQQAGIDMLITADHGNAERMYDPTTGQAHTAHTPEPVPFIYLGRNAHMVKRKGSLVDIAPTMLYLMGLAIPEEMTGQPLVQLT